MRTILPWECQAKAEKVIIRKDWEGNIRYFPSNKKDKRRVKSLLYGTVSPGNIQDALNKTLTKN